MTLLFGTPSYAQAESSFGQLLRINAQSVSVLRAYGQFLMEVVNNENKANSLFDEADRLEEIENRKQQQGAMNVVYGQECETLDASSEQTGFVIISDKPDAMAQVCCAWVMEW